MSDQENDNSTKRIVLFGGTFDPIHLGHITPVVEACTEIKAEQLIYLPCHIPPHKAMPRVTSDMRFEMTQLVAEQINNESPFDVSVSDFELRQAQTSFTRYTVEHFAKLYPEHQLYFLVGMDSLLHFSKWYKWQEILGFCRLLVLQRPGYSFNPAMIEKDILQNLHLSTASEVNISSTELRSQLTNMKNIHCLPPSLIEYIKHHQLYL